MWEEREYKPDGDALKTLAQFREIRQGSWLACEVLLAVRGWSGAGREAVALQRIFDRFWPTFKAFPSMSSTGILMQLDRCRLVDYVFAERGGDRSAEQIETAVSQALVEWVQTGMCDGSVRDTGVVQVLRDGIGLSLTKTRDLNVPGAEVILSALPEAASGTNADIAVLMPFRRSQRAVYESGIRDACVARQLSCKRADEFYGSQHIVSEIYTLIKSARIVVADISGLNPNVFYETGIAHAIGKPVLLIAQRGTKVPFDVQHLRRIEYSQWGSGLARLSAALQAAFVDMLASPHR